MEMEWEIKNNGSFGHGIFARKHIRKWDKVVKIRSNINVLEDFAIRNFCSNCLKSIETSFVCCSKCSFMKYCSNECSMQDAKYHYYECTWLFKVISNLSSSENNSLLQELNLPSRSQRFLMRFVSHLEMKNPDNPHSDLVDNVRFVDDQTIASWEAEIFETRAFVSDFGKNLEMEDLIKLYGILKSNSYMMRLKDSGEVYGSQLIEVHSRINHCCDPNCISTHDNVYSYLIALRDIKDNEEITVSYTDSSMPRSIRQSYLKSNLFFDCKCRLCISDPEQSPEALRTFHKISIIYFGAFILLSLASDDGIKYVDCGLNYFNSLYKEFSEKDPIQKLYFFKNLKNQFADTHWIVHKFADMMTNVVCFEQEFTIEIPGLLIDMNSGLLLGTDTISNPFIALNRYEYCLVLINFCPDLYSSGIVIASVYLPMAVKIKGVDDEVAQKIALLVRKWASILSNIK